MALACFVFLQMLIVLFGYGRVYHVVRQHSCNRTIVPSLRHAASSHGTIEALSIKKYKDLSSTFCCCVRILRKKNMYLSLFAK